MDLRQFAGRFQEVHWLGDQKFKSRCPCPTHHDGDPELSLIAREANGRILVACFADQADSSGQILSALGLTSDDLRFQNGAAKGSKSHAEPFSTNGTRYETGGNGKAPETPSIDYPTWRYHVGMEIKHVLDAIPEKDRPMVASFTTERLADQIVKEAHEVVDQQVAPFWPLPPNLSETDIDEELHRLAHQAIAVFREVYLPAPASSGYALLVIENADQAVVTNEEYLSRPAIVGQLYYTQQTSLTVGGKHEGKTTNTQTEALSVAAGEDVYGRPSLQTPVIYAASSEEYATTRMSLLKMGWQQRKLPLRMVKIRTEDSPEPEDVLAELARMAETEGARFIVLDMLFDFIRVADEIKYAQTRAAVGLIQTLADETKGHVKATHHSPKWMPDAATAAKAALGSQGIAARFSPIVLCRKWADDLYTVESTMTRDPRGMPIKPSVIVRDEYGWARVTEEFKAWMKWKMYADRILGLFDGEPGKHLSVAQIMEALDLSRQETQNAVYQMSLPTAGDKPGVLSRKKHGRRYLYCLSENDLFGGQN